MMRLVILGLLALTAAPAMATTVSYSFTDGAELQDPRYLDLEYGPLFEADPSLGTLTGLRLDAWAHFTLSPVDYDDSAAHWVTGCGAVVFVALPGDPAVEGCARTFQRRNFGFGPDRDAKGFLSAVFTDPAFLTDVLGGGLLLDYLPAGTDGGGTVRFNSVLTFFYDERAVDLVVPAVPLPASALLLFGGLAALRLSRRRTRPA